MGAECALEKLYVKYEAVRCVSFNGIGKEKRSVRFRRNVWWMVSETTGF